MGTTIILSTCCCYYDDDDNASNKCLLYAIHKELTFINSFGSPTILWGRLHLLYYSTDRKTEVQQATWPM